MQGAVSQFLIGIIFIVIGVFSLNGIILLRPYRKKRIKEENKMLYGKKSGIGAIIFGISMVVASLVTYFTNLREIATFIIIVGFSIGWGMMFLALSKYSKY